MYNTALDAGERQTLHFKTMQYYTGNIMGNPVPKDLGLF